jgi:predicted glycosyltransferase
MRLVFYLGHPAHYHLLKHPIAHFKDQGAEVLVMIKKKDILQEICKANGLEFVNIQPEGSGESRSGKILSLLKRDIKVFKKVWRKRPDMMIGSEISLAQVGRLLGIPSLILSEDDAEYVQGFARLAYPFVKHILSPHVCSAWKWEHKKIGYNSLHELAYLHPNHFTPDSSLIKDYVDINKPFFVLRLSKLDAYHDEGKTGITNQLAIDIVNILSLHGQVMINSERPLPEELEPLRTKLPSQHIHHALFYSSLFISDSQTMTAEAAVLGTPSVRFNDFVGKLGYLEDLEHNYELTFGIKTNNAEGLLAKIKSLAEEQLDPEIWKAKREKLLHEKIDLARYLIWFIEQYPSSVKEARNNPQIEQSFR